MGRPPTRRGEFDSSMAVESQDQNAWPAGEQDLFRWMDTHIQFPPPPEEPSQPPQFDVYNAGPQLYHLDSSGYVLAAPQQQYMIPYPPLPEDYTASGTSGLYTPNVIRGEGAYGYYNHYHDVPWSAETLKEEPDWDWDDDSVGLNFHDTNQTAEENSGNDRKRKSSPNNDIEQSANNQNGSKRIRRRFSEDERQRMKETRQRGSCLRCAAKNLKCVAHEGEEACSECSRKKNSSGHQEVCIRAKISDIEGIVRSGPTKPFATTLRWLVNDETLSRPPEIPTYKPVAKPLKAPSSSTGCKEIEISQDRAKLGSITIQVRQFIWVEHLDRVQDHKWYDNNGICHTYACPSWAISNVEATKSAIKRFMDSSLDKYLKKKVEENQKGGPIISSIRRLAFDAARRVDNVVQNTYEASLPGQALTFWQASRFIEQPWTIVGKETLDMEPDRSLGSPFENAVPVPPMMDFQFDNLVINHQLRPLIKDIRKSLKEKMFKNRPEDWFDCYLTAFILLDHVERTVAHDIYWARRHNMPDDISNPPLIRRLELGAKTLLNIFHHLNNGSYAFTEPDWSNIEQFYKWNGTDSEQTRIAKAHVKAVREKLSQQQQRQPESSIRAAIREEPGFWTSQLHRPAAETAVSR